MMDIPNFYKLLVGKDCPICREEFLLNIYPEVNNENSIIFYKECYIHPTHVDCSLRFYESTDLNNAMCVVCRKDLTLDAVMMTPMLPPQEIADPQLQPPEIVDSPSEDDQELQPPPEIVDSELLPSASEELLPPPPSEEVDPELQPVSEDVASQSEDAHVQESTPQCCGVPLLENEYYLEVEGRPRKLSSRSH